jgi:hypothetical protein
MEEAASGLVTFITQAWAFLRVRIGRVGRLFVPVAVHESEISRISISP